MNIVEVVKVLIKTNEIELKADQTADQIEEKITRLVDEKITRLFENKLK
jgi:non-homologous end joining protein Ku